MLLSILGAHIKKRKRKYKNQNMLEENKKYIYIYIYQWEEYTRMLRKMPKTG